MESVKENQSCFNVLSYFKTITPLEPGSNASSTRVLSAHYALNGSLLDDQAAIQCVSSYISDICSGTNTTNLVKLHNAIFYFLSLDMYKLFNTVYSCFCNEAQKIKNTFQQLIDTNAFTPAIYYETKSHYNSISPWHIFSFVKQYVKITPDKNDIGHILNEYAFYCIVIEPLYNYDGSQHHIFDILREKTSDSQLAILFKIYNQYAGFSFSVLDVNARHMIFNPKIDTITRKLFMSDEALINNLVTIDGTIKALCSCSDKTAKEKHINNVVDIVDMCQKIGNNHLFFTIYKTHLQKRLISNNYNIDLEATLAKFLNFIRNPDECILIQYSINDFIGNGVINKLYRSIDIKGVSPTYERVSIDQTLSNFCIGRSFVWETLQSNSIYDKLTPPAVLSIYTESFKRFYKEYLDKRHMSISNRVLTYNYPLSNVELNLTFGEQQCAVKTTFIQACIVIYINDNENLTAFALAKLIGLPLKYINSELNSLLLAGLIERDATYDKTDQSMSFTINKQFSCCNTDMIKFIDEYNDLPNKKFAQDKASIMQLLSSGQRTTFDEMNIEATELEKCLQSLLEQGLIKNTDGVYALNTNETQCCDDIEEKIEINDEFSDISDQDEN